MLVLGISKLGIVYMGGWPKLMAFRDACDVRLRAALASCSDCKPALQGGDDAGSDCKPVHHDVDKSMPKDIDKIEAALTAALGLIQRNKKVDHKKFGPTNLDGTIFKLGVYDNHWEENETSRTANTIDDR